MADSLDGRLCIETFCHNLKAQYIRYNLSGGLDRPEKIFDGIRHDVEEQITVSSELTNPATEAKTFFFNSGFSGTHSWI